MERPPNRWIELQHFGDDITVGGKTYSYQAGRGRLSFWKQADAEYPHITVEGGARDNFGGFHLTDIKRGPTALGSGLHSILLSHQFFAYHPNTNQVAADVRGGGGAAETEVHDVQQAGQDKVSFPSSDRGRATVSTAEAYKDDYELAGLAAAQEVARLLVENALAARGDQGE